MLDYPSLAAVAAVVREGSFERAATALKVTPSAISQRVRSLEERLGTILVVRGQPCTATSTGARICAHVERVRLLEGEMVDTLPELEGEAGKAKPVTLRIGVNRDSLGTWFMPALARFSARSGTMVDLVLDREEYTTDRLRNGDVLAAITDDASVVQGCQKMALGSLRYLATATPGFISRWFPTGIDAVSLNSAPVLVFDRGDDLQAQWTRQAIGATLEAPIHWMPATQAFLEATLEELGWGMNPEMLARPHIENGRLLELLPGRPCDVPLYWQYARIGARLIDALTEEVLSSARVALQQPSP